MLKGDNTINCHKEFEPARCIKNFFERRGFKTSNFAKECMNSLVLLPPRNFAVFESQFLLECYIQRATNFTSHEVSQALSMFVVNSWWYVKEEKCKQSGQQRLSY